MKLNSKTVSGRDLHSKGSKYCSCNASDLNIDKRKNSLCDEKFSNTCSSSSSRSENGETYVRYEDEQSSEYIVEIGSSSAVNSEEILTTDTQRSSCNIKSKKTQPTCPKNQKNVTNPKILVLF